MALCNLKNALDHAEQSGYAIGSFNLTGEDILIGILQAAVEQGSPVILSIAEAHISYMRWRSFMKMVIAEAESAPVPVVIHLDHATRLETIYQALQLGFTSIMYDGSVLSLDENIANTRLIASIAHSLDISVEAELGHIGGTTEEVGVPHHVQPEMTDPSLVPGFIEQTSIDALAVAFGTAHGYYKGQPNLNYDLLHQIRQRAVIPLVLHGGSGLSDEAFRRSIRTGIRKINYGTDLFATSTQAARHKLCQEPDLIHYAGVCLEVRKAVKERVSGYLKLWGSAGKSWLN